MSSYDDCFCTPNMTVAGCPIHDNNETGGWLSPDCRDGNHQKCDGVAWDLAKDEPTKCACPHPQHRP